MYQSQDFRHLLGLPGFSDTLLTNHIALYEGYVANVNKLADRLSALVASDQAATPEYAELKRRFGWEWNGMRLHELYFGNLTKDVAVSNPAGALGERIVRDFGSYDAWEKDFRATGAMRGIGWVILYLDVCGDGRLMNAWIGEHDTGHPAGAVPILVMDVFEHAFVLDYGIKRTDYIAAFMVAIDWAAAARRFDDAMTA